MPDEANGWRPPASVPPPGYQVDRPPTPSAPAYVYPQMSPPPPVEEPPRPDQLRVIAGLLIVNLSLSIIVTVISLFARHSIINYQLDHRHITDPRIRQTLRSTYSYTIVSRAIGNVVASVVYLFLVRALFRGRRWAYRRVIWLGVGGGAALLIAQASPYPLWWRVEALSQVVVLAALVYLVTRPAVRAHFASGLPGRDIGRFRK